MHTLACVHICTHILPLCVICIIRWCFSLIKAICTIIIYAPSTRLLQLLFLILSMLLQKLLVTVHARCCVNAYYIGSHHLEKLAIYMHKITKDIPLFYKRDKQKVCFNVVIWEQPFLHKTCMWRIQYLRKSVFQFEKCIGASACVWVCVWMCMGWENVYSRAVGVHFDVVAWDVRHGTFGDESLQVQLHGRIKVHYRLWWKVIKLKRKKNPLGVQDR